MDREERLPLKIALKKNIGNIADLFHKTAEGEKSMRVLTYHNITDRYVRGDWVQKTTPIELFDRQMRYLRDNNYNVINADKVPEILTCGAAVPLKTVSITFDDGYEDNYTNAFPVLEKYGLEGTVFLTAGFIGKEKEDMGKFLNWPQIKEMREKGAFTFGCHSLSHRNLAILSGGELKSQIRDSRKILEDNMGARVNTFAYPFGWHNSFNRRVAEAVRNEGYLCAFTGVSGPNTEKTGLFTLKRISVSWLDGLDEFQKILRGSYDWYHIYQRAVSVWKEPLAVSA